MIKEKNHNIVYKIKCKINNKIYIGIHATNNINDEYMGSGSELIKDQNKYGVINFDKSILYDYSTINEALLKEAEIVDDDFLQRQDTYNISNGGGAILVNKSTLINDTGLIDFIKTAITDSIITKEFTKELIPLIKNHIIKNTCDKLIDDITKDEWVQIGLRNNWFRKSVHSTCTRNKISQSKIGKPSMNKGKIWITDNQSNKSRLINPEQLDKFIKQGWSTGRLIKSN